MMDAHGGLRLSPRPTPQYFSHSPRVGDISFLSSSTYYPPALMPPDASSARHVSPARLRPKLFARTYSNSKLPQVCHLRGTSRCPPRTHRQSAGDSFISAESILTSTVAINSGAQRWYLGTPPRTPPRYRG